VANSRSLTAVRQSAATGFGMTAEWYGSFGAGGFVARRRRETLRCAQNDRGGSVLEGVRRKDGARWIESVPRGAVTSCAVKNFANQQSRPDLTVPIRSARASASVCRR
jgi:hypothetical protein